MFSRAQMMSTEEKLQKDSIRKGWTTDETLQQSIKQI
uniref:Ubiquinol-cytochrome c reductase complex assembly factor 5 n=1 Tax=Sciurus vulgaris TaxID=55149 RepID=A0A8D2DK71_SCIVU